MSESEAWVTMIVSLLFWVALVAAISYGVARAVVRRELQRHTFSSAMPEEHPLPDTTPQGPHD